MTVDTTAKAKARGALRFLESVALLHLGLLAACCFLPLLLVGETPKGALPAFTFDQVAWSAPLAFEVAIVVVIIAGVLLEAPWDSPQGDRSGLVYFVYAAGFLVTLLLVAPQLGGLDIVPHFLTRTVWGHGLIANLGGVCATQIWLPFVNRVDRT